MHLNFTDRVSGKASLPANTSSVAPSKAASLARAFTTSVKGSKDRDEGAMGRSSSQRVPLRAQISPPVALISTTNMLSYDAPDIPQALLRRQQQQAESTHRSPSSVTRKASSVSTATSDSSSVHSRHSSASHTTAGTSLSVEGFSPESPEPNHLTCYFKQAGPHSATRTTPSSPALSRASGSTNAYSPLEPLTPASPQIPSRANSHSMKAHVMSHKRSVSSRVSSTSSSQPSSRHDSMTSDAFSTSSQQRGPTKTTTSPHPFSKELEQLNEVAEEFSSTVRDAEQSADVGVLQAKGLGNFCATEYMREIAPLFSSAFADDLAASTPAWI